MKNLIVILLFSLLWMSCSKEKTQPTETNKTYHVNFIYKGETIASEQSVVNDSLVFANTVENNKIQELLSKDNISLYQDLQLGNIFVFDSSEEMITFSKKFIKNLKSASSDTSFAMFYENKDFGGRVLNAYLFASPYTGFLGIRDLSVYGFNDVISSYQTYLPYNVCVVYQDIDFGGKSLAWGPSALTMSDANLNDNLMSGTLLWKKYWNDNVSSIKFIQ